MKLFSVLLFVLLAGCPLNKKRGKNVVDVKDRELPYEIPPGAPVPPEDYCFEIPKGQAGVPYTTVRLTVEADSVYGKVDYKSAQQTDGHGNFVGVIYGTTLLVSYKDDKQAAEDQEWKLEGDSLYQKPFDSAVLDSTQSKKPDVYKTVFPAVMLKVACK